MEDSIAQQQQQQEQQLACEEYVSEDLVTAEGEGESVTVVVPTTIGEEVKEEPMLTTAAAVAENEAAAAFTAIVNSPTPKRRKAISKKKKTAAAGGPVPVTASSENFSIVPIATDIEKKEPVKPKRKPIGVRHAGKKYATMEEFEAEHVEEECPLCSANISQRRVSSTANDEEGASSSANIGMRDIIKAALSQGSGIFDRYKRLNRAAGGGGLFTPKPRR